MTTYNRARKEPSPLAESERSTKLEKSFRKGMNEINPPRTEELIQQLVALWEQSVQASHHFLTSDNIEQLTPFVKIGGSSIETLVVKYDADRPIAFMGIDHDKIELLFVLPLYFGKGIGKELVMSAVEKYNVKYADVNEQKHAATGV